MAETGPKREGGFGEGAEVAEDAPAGLGGAIRRLRLCARPAPQVAVRGERRRLMTNVRLGCLLTR